VELGFERIDRSWLFCSVRKLHLVVFSPILIELLLHVLALHCWVLIITRIVYPKHLIFLVGICEFRQLSSMDSKHLVSEFLGHVTDHLLDSSFFESPLIESHSVKTFVSEPIDAVFSVLNSCLAFLVSFKVALNFLELLD